MANAKAAVPAAPDDYQAESDVRALMRAHQIRADPKRHKAAKAHAQKQVANMSAIATGGVPPAPGVPPQF